MGKMMGLKTIIIIAAFCGLALQPTAYSKTVNDTIVVTDDIGNTVQLDAPARRIISLAPHNTENLFFVGAGKWLVGAVSFSDYPSAAKKVPEVGRYDRVNIEAILALQPDLVVAWASGNPLKSTQRLIELGVPVFYSEPHNFADVLNNMRQFATLTGTEKQSAEPIKTLEQRYIALTEKYVDKPAVSVFYQVWNEPLITLNGKHTVSHAIHSCGGKNVFANLPIIAPTISTESVIAANPDVILISGPEKDHPHWKNEWQEWSNMNAVKNQQLVFVNPDWVTRPTARLVDGTRSICEILEKSRPKN